MPLWALRCTSCLKKLMGEKLWDIARPFNSTKKSERGIKMSKIRVDDMGSNGQYGHHRMWHKVDSLISPDQSLTIDKVAIECGL